MAVRDDFSAGEVLSAADLNDTFASKLAYSYGTAEPTTSDSGFLWYDENDTPPTPKFWDGAAFQALTSGKILQIVRATDSTRRTTNSSSYVDVTGMSVTITPQKSDSTILVIASFDALARVGCDQARFRISDASNNALSGAEECNVAEEAFRVPVFLIGYSTPATTSATTYKLRFSAFNTAANAEVVNDDHTGQMYAIEVSA